MEREIFWESTVHGAVAVILDYIQLYRDKKVIYFDGWCGFGAAPVLRSITQVLLSKKDLPPELCFDRIIYIDCSAWENRRTMQRKIAEELKLDHATMAMFDKHDEEDDFNGVDHSSRDVIRSVSAVIVQTLGSRNCMLIFLNGSDDEVDVSRFGLSPEYHDHVIVWTFERRFLTMHQDRAEDKIAGKLRYTHLFVTSFEGASDLRTSEFSALLHGEAEIIVARNPRLLDIDQTMVADCCLYELFLYYGFHSATGFDWVAHASNFWACDGIIKGDRTMEISNVLHQEISWECDASLLKGVSEKFMKDQEAPFCVVKDEIAYEKRPFRWIFVTSKNLKVQENMQTLLERASSLFVAFERSNNPHGLPNELFNYCSNLGVLILSWCAFSFASPPFLQCHRLRFLGLDHCMNGYTSAGEDCTKWACLLSLWVLDIRYTDWDEILTEEKMDLMANLRELNIEGVSCWQYTSRLHGRLSYLRRLRIIKPTHQAETSIDSSNSFMDKTKLEILNLSGNKDMKNLPASLSKVSSLQVLILDGCDGLQNVVLPSGFPSSLTSFSFDGYGSASHWKSTVDLPPESSRPKRPSDANKRDVKTLKINLQGCTQLENLFLRGLPNLMELDLSGSAIKLLDFVTMVVAVPRLKRLFLLGCEHLRGIRWGTSNFIIPQQLELLCIDTRSKRTLGCTRPSLRQHKSFRLQVHAILADARLARSLWPLVSYYQDKLYFGIHITSSTIYGDIVQLEATKKEMVKSSWYNDVFAEIGDAPMQAFPRPPTTQLGRHIEIGDGGLSVESELAISRKRERNLAVMMTRFAESLHVHDISTSVSVLVGEWERLRWCRVERCPNLDTVFPQGTDYWLRALETIWASHLLMARCILDKLVRVPAYLDNLQHLHLRSCPRLQFVLPVCGYSFPNLKTLHVIHCGHLMHVFVFVHLPARPAEEVAVRGVLFPKLATIHLHDLPNLRQICEVKMLAPALDTIRIRGCFGLRRLPAVEARKPGSKRPTVEIEKDVWDALEWDGLAADHHPERFEPPVHSRYYKRRLLRGTVLSSSTELLAYSLCATLPLALPR
ncbi:uncharacterized protein LOC133890211 [Phragmites australis]|uniref:uncharacterized protein LOC133890211 n=1 Tax=Phragmites australis TaxID=29695 RepID=UPI002D7A1342|nr:uncharacterized protein LOC133890211 [Phragmites australis]